MSVLLHRLLDDHASLITHVRDLQNVISYDLFFQSPLFCPLRELMDRGWTFPPSPLMTPTPTHRHHPPLTPSRPASQGVARWRKVYAPQFDPSGRRPFGSLLSRVQSCVPSSPRQQIQMQLQMEVTNLSILHGEEMVKGVLMDMMQEMRPPLQHNAFKCRNCQWVERRGKMMLKPCENSPAYRPAPPPYEEDFCSTCLSFEDCPCPDP